MKNMIITFLSIMCFGSLLGQDTMTKSPSESPTEAIAQTCSLTIELTDLKSDEGLLMVGLYNTADTWLAKNYKGEITEIKDGKATVVFDNLPYGIYAVSSIHDEDSNHELNTGLFGIPSEPYASSRGAKGRFGPPKWEDAKFELSSATAIEIIKF